MPEERCWNCGRAIGSGETPHVFDRHVVCRTCDASLRNPDPASVDPVPRCPLCRQQMVHVGQWACVAPQLIQVVAAAGGTIFLLLAGLGMIDYVARTAEAIESGRGMSVLAGLEPLLLTISGLLSWILVGVLSIADPRRLRCPRCGATHKRS